jgi:hypothetical protein
MRGGMKINPADANRATTALTSSAEKHNVIMPTGYVKSGSHRRAIITPVEQNERNRL